MIVPKYYEDPGMLHENTMPSRAYYIPAPERMDCLAEHREASPRMQMLNGNWKFRYYASIWDLEERFYDPDFDSSYFGSIRVPGVWQTAGYDRHQYTNIASCSEYTYLTRGKRVDGTMYSCTSLGVKLGGGLGTAIAGWLLEFSGFDGMLAVQPKSCMDMLHVMYLWLPFVIDVVILVVLSQMNVEGANERLRAERDRREREVLP